MPQAGAKGKVNMEWFRTYHGISNDSKWPLIARKSGQNVGTVVSVWMALLDHASQDDERGSVAEFDCEEIDVLYGYEDGTTLAVVAAMEAKGMIVDGCIQSWTKRQVQDEGAAERKRLQREREKLAKEKAELEKQRHAASQREEKSKENCGDVTTCHAVSQDVTACHEMSLRTEQRRKENINTPSKSPTGDGNDSAPPSPRQSGTNPRAVSMAQQAETPPQPDGTAATDATDDPWISGGLDVDMGFQEFFDAYPPQSRGYAGSAGKAWKALAKRKALPAMWRLMDSLDAWKKSDEWAKEGGKYIPAAARFLADKIFQEEPHVWKPPTKQAEEMPDWEKRRLKACEELTQLRAKEKQEAQNAGK